MSSQSGPSTESQPEHSSGSRLESTYRKTQFYPELESFRAVSILFIIAAHCWTLPIIFFNVYSTGKFNVADNLKPTLHIAEVLFHSSTLFFAIISGLLFTLVLKDRGWKAFYISKLRYVVIPYMIMTFAYTYWEFQFKVDLTNHQNAFFLMERSAINVLTGGGFFHLWYIPILIVLFILTPVFSQLVCSGKGRVLAVCLILAPLLISRIWPEPSWKTVFYFSGAYLGGIWAGMYYEDFCTYVKKHTLLLVGVIIVTSVVNYAFYHFNIKLLGEVNVQETVFYIQKLAMAMVILVWLKYSHFTQPTWIRLLAHYAFTIYLVHAFFIQQIIKWLHKYELASLETWPIVLFGSGFLIVSPLLSVVFTLIVKKVTGKYSRTLIGS